MSGGSQHNPNGRQAQLAPGWSPLQVANFLARAPQAHMASERGVTWHTPTPPPHLYHVPAPSPPDPLQALLQLQAMKGANAVFRHTATPPDLYRHTPTPPDKHLLRHTPSPGDVKASTALPPTELFPHLGPGREKLRPEEILAYGRAATATGGVDLSLGARSVERATPPPAPAPAPALSVRDAPTINSLIARAQPRHGSARVDSLLERLAPAPVPPAPLSPHSVIVPPRAAAAPAPPLAPAVSVSLVASSRPEPSPPSSNEDSTDGIGAPPGSKRKRKPERTIRVAAPPAPAPPPRSPLPDSVPLPVPEPRHNGDAEHIEIKFEVDDRTNYEGSPVPPRKSPVTSEPASEPSRLMTPPPARVVTPPCEPCPPPEPHTRRKTRSGSAETIDDIAAMVAAPVPPCVVPQPLPPPTPSADAVETVLARLMSESPPPPTSNPTSNPPTNPTSNPPTNPTSNPPTNPTSNPPTNPTSNPPTNPTSNPPTHPTSSPSTNPPTSSNPSPVTTTIAPTSTTTNPLPVSSSTSISTTPPLAGSPRGVAAPKRRGADVTNVPVESPSEAKPAEPEAGDRTAEPVAASFVEVENQLEKMFAGIEEPPTTPGANPSGAARRGGGRKRRRGSTRDNGPRRQRRKPQPKGKSAVLQKEPKDAYDSGSNASSSRSRGPYIQIRGPRSSPLSVSVMNAGCGEEESCEWRARGSTNAAFRNGLRVRGLHASTLGLRYDATTPDATWRCAFCNKGPHAAQLGDLFGPYTVDTDCDEFRSLDEATRRQYETSNGCEVWFHEACGVWAPGLVACGARLWGLAGAVWGAKAALCAGCGVVGAGIACSQRACPLRVHVPCAETARWKLCHDTFRAFCPRHSDA